LRVGGGYTLGMPAEYFGTQNVRGRRPANSNRIAPDLNATMELSDEQKEEMELKAKAKMEELGQRKAWVMMKRRVLNFLEDQVIAFYAMLGVFCHGLSLTGLGIQVFTGIMIVATTFSLYGTDIWEAAGPPHIKYDVIIYSVSRVFENYIPSTYHKTKKKRAGQNTTHVCLWKPQIPSSLQRVGLDLACAHVCFTSACRPCLLLEKHMKHATQNTFF
jgi:hypothetical protein